MSRQWLLAATLLLPALSVSGQLPDRAMMGTWSGDGQIVVNWTSQRSIHVRLVILADGNVSGEVGDARLTNGRIARNRGAIGRFLNIKTDYIVFGDLRGPVIASEHIQRDGVKMPLNWNEREFSGGLHTSGSAFGGADRMIFTAFHLRLTRERLAIAGGLLHHALNGHRRVDTPTRIVATDGDAPAIGAGDIEEA
jgi:hypothetical protein